MDHERLLYRQTIRLLIKELERLDPANDEAREANDLLQQTSPGAERSATGLASAAAVHRERRRADHSPLECQAPAGQAPGERKRFSLAGGKTGASIVAVALLLVLAPSARQATAQASLCDQANAGRMEVQGGVRCVCIRTQGGLIAPAPPGWQWDCSVLRSRNNALIEAAPGGYEGELPSSVYIDEGWHEIPEDQGGDRKRMGRTYGPDRKRPDFHDRDRHRSRRDRLAHPGPKSSPFLRCASGFQGKDCGPPRGIAD
jgi:hypothetical protein